MRLDQIRARIQEVITGLHAAGLHTEAFALGDRLYAIGHQPLMHHALAALDDAERLAADI
jgi:hypothetical protein